MRSANLGSAAAQLQPDAAMPKAFYKVSESRYVEAGRYDALRAQPGSQLPEKAKAPALLFSTNGDKSLMSGQQMRRYHPDRLAELRREQGLPPTIEKQHDAQPPKALIYDRQSRELVSPAIAQQRLGVANISAHVEARHIYLSNMNSNGRPTGNFSNAPYYQTRNTAAALAGRLATDVNAPNPPSAARATNAASVAGNERVPNSAAVQRRSDLPSTSGGVQARTGQTRSRQVAVAQFQGNLDIESTEMLLAQMRGDLEAARGRSRPSQSSRASQESGRNTPTANLIDPYGDQQGRHSHQTGRAGRAEQQTIGTATVIGIERAVLDTRVDRDRSRQRGHGR